MKHSHKGTAILTAVKATLNAYTYHALANTWTGFALYRNNYIEKIKITSKSYCVPHDNIDISVKTSIHVLTHIQVHKVTKVVI